MGELVVGTPALRLAAVVSLPLDLVSFLSLLYRAVPGSDLDPWLVDRRRTLPPDLRANLDLLHGFSGRLLYYVEEPVMRFEPLRSDRLDASFDDLIAFLDGLPPADYRAMAAHALDRVHRDLDLPDPTLGGGDETAWRRALQPALTTATADEVLPLVADPSRLKARTLALFRGIWEAVYRDEHAAWLPLLRDAARLAAPAVDRGFGLAFADLTGNRPPAPLIARLTEVDRVAFCPSAHLGSFVSYVLYPPDLIVFFDPVQLAARLGQSDVASASTSPASPRVEPDGLDTEALLEALRALADPTRLRVLDLLGEGELYAQEIVGRLGIAQSAVSRHLAQLERAGLVTVRPRRGSKYYALAPDQLDRLAQAVRAKARPGASSGPAADRHP